MEELSLLTNEELQDKYNSSRLNTTTKSQQLRRVSDEEQAVLQRELIEINDLMRAIEVEAGNRGVRLI